jgi:hypothetical protein
LTHWRLLVETKASKEQRGSNPTKHEIGCQHSGAGKQNRRVANMLPPTMYLPTRDDSGKRDSKRRQPT